MGSLGFRCFCVMFVMFAALTVSSCEKKRTTTKPIQQDDDSDFGLGLLEEFNNTKGQTKKRSDDAKLTGAIVQAVTDFTKNNNINLGVLLSSLLRTGTFETTRKQKRNAKTEDAFDADEFDLLRDELFDQDDDKKDEKSDDKLITPSNVQSYVHKVPSKRMLSAQTLDANLLQMSDDYSRENSTKFNDDDIQFFGNVSGVENLLEVFSVTGIIRNWNGIKTKLTSSCRKQMGQYMRGVIAEKFWALKMDDASGRYSSGYYWGNGYWAGSATSCLQDLPSSLENKDNKNDGDPTRNDFTGTTKSETDIKEKAPFDVAFFNAKVLLNTSKTYAGPHIIQIGLCLPEGCMSEDIKNIVEMSDIKNKPKVLNIRDPKHNNYDMFSDMTFQILVIVVIVVSILISIGTIYEFILIMQVKRSSLNKLNHHSLKLNITPVTNLPSVKISNGKSIYSVNGISNNNNNSEERLNIEPQIIEESGQLSIFSELILSFSLISNMKTICDQSVGSDTIPTIHGLRSISMVWVILGHSCIVAFKYSDNTELRKVVEKEFFFQTVTNATFSVDTFFCISGILVSYIYFRTNAKGSLERLTKGTKGFTSGFLQFIGLLGYRFARLTAPYLFMLGVVEVSMKWFYYNSIFDPPTQDHVNCPNYWWRNVLYINTLFPVEQMCMLWSWYLADDSQFYVLGAIILILAASHFKMAAGALSVFLISSWITTGYIAWSHNHMPSIDDPLALFDKIYDKPWTRLGPYLIGMAAGWLLFKTDCKIKMSKIFVAVGWFISALVLLCLVYGLYNSNLSPVTAAAYTSLSHTAWGMSVAWIVIACSTGHGGYINSLLSATILYPFSRVTYCAYLVHPVVIRFLPMHMDHPIHLGKDMMTIIFLGQMVSSYLLAFIVSLAFEAPVVTMLKILAPNKRKKIQ